MTRACATCGKLIHAQRLKAQPRAKTCGDEACMKANTQRMSNLRKRRFRGK